VATNFVGFIGFHPQFACHSTGGGVRQKVQVLRWTQANQLTDQLTILKYLTGGQGDSRSGYRQALPCILFQQCCLTTALFHGRMPDISPYITEYILSRKKDPQMHFSGPDTGYPLSQKCSVTSGDLEPHLIHGFGPTQVFPQPAHDRFSHFCITYHGPDTQTTLLPISVTVGRMYHCVAYRCFHCKSCL